MDWYIWVSYFIILNVDIGRCNSKKPSYILLERIEECSDTPKIWGNNVNLRKYNRTMPMLCANWTLDRNLDDSISISILISRWGDGGWKHNFIKIEKGKACSTLMFFFSDTMKRILTNINVPVNCPIPKGSYALTNFSAKMTVPNLGINYGKYLSLVKLLDPIKTTLWCLKFISFFKE